MKNTRIIRVRIVRVGNPNLNFETLIRVIDEKTMFMFWIELEHVRESLCRHIKN